MKLGASLVVAMILVCGARSADAALTSSEAGQIRDFVKTARAENAVRVRSLVARTDLTAEESMTALSDAVAPVPFTDQRAVFLRELTFGVSSASSRPLLAHAVTRALLARADAVLARYAGSLDREPRAVAELVAIYAFLDEAIANAGHPTATAHDASAGISAAAYEDCAKELRAHIEHSARWLKGQSAIPESVGRVRAQVQVALVDMLPDGLTRRVDAADRLGLEGSRRQMLTEWGIVLQDAGKLDEAKASQVRAALARLPGARAGLELIYAGDDRTGPLHARGQVAFVGGAGAGESSPFGDEVSPTTAPLATAAILQDLAVLATKRAMDEHADLRAQAEHDAAAAAQSDKGRMLGRPRAPSVDHVIGAAAQLLALDAPRAIDQAFVRVVNASRPESAALLSDAIGALAAFGVAPAATAKAKPAASGVSIDVGNGAGAPIKMSAIHLAPNGAAVGFTIGGHAWAITRTAPSYAVTGITRDGQLLSIAQLTTVKTPAHPAHAPAKPPAKPPAKKK